MGCPGNTSPRKHLNWVQMDHKMGQVCKGKNPQGYMNCLSRVMIRAGKM